MKTPSSCLIGRWRCVFRFGISSVRISAFKANFWGFTHTREMEYGSPLLDLAIASETVLLPKTALQQGPTSGPRLPSRSTRFPESFISFLEEGENHPGRQRADPSLSLSLSLSLDAASLLCLASVLGKDGTASRERKLMRDNNDSSRCENHGSHQTELNSQGMANKRVLYPSH